MTMGLKITGFPLKMSEILVESNLEYNIPLSSKKLLYDVIYPEGVLNEHRNREELHEYNEEYFDGFVYNEIKYDQDLVRYIYII